MHGTRISKAQVSTQRIKSGQTAWTYQHRHQLVAMIFSSKMLLLTVEEFLWVSARRLGIPCEQTKSHGVPGWYRGFGVSVCGYPLMLFNPLFFPPSNSAHNPPRDSPIYHIDISLVLAEAVSNIRSCKWRSPVLWKLRKIIY